MAMSERPVLELLWSLYGMQEAISAKDADGAACLMTNAVAAAEAIAMGSAEHPISRYPGQTGDLRTYIHDLHGIIVAQHRQIQMLEAENAALTDGYGRSSNWRYQG